MNMTVKHVDGTILNMLKIKYELREATNGESTNLSCHSYWAL